MSSDIPTLRLRGPAEVLAAMPYVVGYYPSDSIVVLGMYERRLTFAARDDLPLPEASEREICDQVDHLLDVLLRQSCTSVLVVGVGEAARVDRLAVALLDAYESAGLVVQEAMRAHEGRFWSYLCDSPTCCPPDGVLYDPMTSTVAAEWTFAGRVAFRDRAEYETQLRPVTGAARDAMREATDAAHRRLHSLLLSARDERSAAASLLTAGEMAVDLAVTRQFAGGTLADEEVAWLSVLLLDIPVRDLGWARIRGSIEDLEQHQALWTDVVRRCEPDLIAPPASLLGFAAWRCGDGGMARMALERAVAQEPGYTMAGALLTALSRGIPPTSWDDLPELLIRPRRGPRPRRRSSSGRARSQRR
jgi:Domain of unknown function (DUF4192)